VSRQYLTPILLPGDPAAAMEAATKQYVDARAGDEVFIGPSAPGAGYELWIDTDAAPTGATGWVQLTQAAYDALSPPDPNTLYVVVG
jgi:hypothetical protein